MGRRVGDLYLTILQQPYHDHDVHVHLLTSYD
jgi:hypothetical protein